MFAWGCADAEPITSNDKANFEQNELYRLISYVLADKTWGSTKWACWKRNQRPQKPVIDKMKKDNAWDKLMKSLPKSKDLY